MRNSLLFLALAGAFAMPAAHAQVLGLGGNGGGGIQAGPINVGGQGSGRAGGNVGGLTETTRSLDGVGNTVRDSATAARAKAAQAARVDAAAKAAAQASAQASAAPTASVDAAGRSIDAGAKGAVDAKAATNAADAKAATDALGAKTATEAVDANVKASGKASAEVGAGATGDGAGKPAR